MEFLLRDGPPRYHTLDYLVEYNADGPGVAADTVQVVLECLGWHVDGRAHIVALVLLELLPGDGETKIPDFVRVAPVEYIGRLDVPVQVPTVVDIHVAVDDLFDDVHGLAVRDALALLQQVAQVSVAQLGDQVGIVFGGVDIVQVQDSRRK